MRDGSREAPFTSTAAPTSSANLKNEVARSRRCRIGRLPDCAASSFGPTSRCNAPQEVAGASTGGTHDQFQSSDNYGSRTRICFWPSRERGSHTQARAMERDLAPQCRSLQVQRSKYGRKERNSSLSYFRQSRDHAVDRCQAQRQVDALGICCSDRRQMVFDVWQSCFRPYWADRSNRPRNEGRYEEEQGASWEGDLDRFGRCKRVSWRSRSGRTRSPQSTLTCCSAAR